MHPCIKNKNFAINISRILSLYLMNECDECVVATYRKQEEEIIMGIRNKKNEYYIELFHCPSNILFLNALFPYTRESLLLSENVTVRQDLCHFFALFHLYTNVRDSISIVDQVPQTQKL